MTLMKIRLQSFDSYFNKRRLIILTRRNFFIRKMQAPDMARLDTA